MKLCDADLIQSVYGMPADAEVTSRPIPEYIRIDSSGRIRNNYYTGA